MSIAQLITNDLAAGLPGHYRVTGDDPYVIFNARQQAQEPRYLRLELDTRLNDLPLEIFFRSENDLFDPYYKISFISSSFPAAIELPKGISFTKSTRLRLDINKCPDCSIKFEQSPVLVDQVDAGTNRVKPSRVQNGLNLITTKPATISTADWQLNDLVGEPNYFEVAGADPFLVSPQLTLSTSGLAGVYFKLKVPKSGQMWNNYQLFYQTERQSFSKQASSIIRVPDSDNEVVEFMFPLDFLSTEEPADAVLERIRLDIPIISGDWSLIETHLVHQDLKNDYQDLIPTLLIQIKQQRATGLSLIKKSLLNVTSDLAFSIGYPLLLIFSAWFFIRAYRSNSE
ncbi:MAG: hypothetical protein ACJAQ6_000861 [Arenicella sp.]|jgi:hypothetical protein